MEDLKYCRACLVTDVKMYSLDITSNDSIGLVYSQLAQIRICDRNQNICFECASLLRKYHRFKSKCLRAHSLLSNITVNSTELTKHVIVNIDRKENKLESNLMLTNEFSIDSNTEILKDNIITIKADIEADKDELKIKTEEQINDQCDVKETHNGYIENESVDNSERNMFIDVTVQKKKTKIVKEPKSRKRKIKNEAPITKVDVICDNAESINNFNENNLNSEHVFTESDHLKDEKKTKVVKEPKTRKQRIKKEIQFSEEEICDVNDPIDDFDDTDFIDPYEENTQIDSTEEHKTNIKMKTIVNSDDDFSDNEPLSKAKLKNKSQASVVKRNGLNLDFFDDYATVVFLTTEDAKKELLTRKDSSNYKRSPFKCDFCYKGYEAKAAFDTHMRKHTSEHGDYDCDICHLRFFKQIYLCKHKLSCHKRKFSCKICPYICYCMYQARTHVSLHKGKRYPCKDCGEIFSMPNSLQMHRRVHHRGAAPAERACELCGDVFATPRGLFLHNMKLHRTDKNDKLGPKCEECGAHFASEAAWKRHLVLSTKHIVDNGCKYCGERFTNEEELKSHRRTHHPRIKRQNKSEKKLPGTCSICNKWLRSRMEYITHMTTEHPQSEETKKLNPYDLTPFVCEVCGQVFKKQCFLTYHQRKHTGERPYKCVQCDKTFQTSSALHIHSAIHSRRRAFKCDICARVFSSKSALNKHMKGHLGIRPHKCTLCDKGFLHMCDLKLHIKYVHDKVPWPKKKSKRNISDENATYLD